MSFLDKLERKLGRYAVPNVTFAIVIGQAFLFLFSYSGWLDITRAMLEPELVLRGEWWRLLTFLFIPPSWSPIFIFFALYLFYLMGTALENHWGAFRYNVFLLVGYVLMVCVSFLTPFHTATNVFIGGSVFLAFAYLFPEFQLYIFFILPVKIKWLALLTWIGYGWVLITGTWQARFSVLASVGNVLLFFGTDIFARMKYGRRKMAQQAREIAGKREPFHRCAICGKTDISHPDAEFRYCPDCGGAGYCLEHIGNHEHRKRT